MEFDKSRVYTSANADELRAGDWVIVADTLEDLKEQVKKGDVYEIEDILAECEKDRFGICGMANYALAYLVERKENCTNCKGCVACIKPDKTFVCEDWKPKTEKKCCSECRNVGWASSELCSKKHKIGEANNCIDFEKITNKHYRPFKDSDELVKVWCKKSEETPPVLDMPYIWVKYKGDDTDKGRLIISYSNNGCSVIDVDEIKVMLWEDLFEKCVFLDGSPCGVEE